MATIKRKLNQRGRVYRRRQFVASGKMTTLRRLRRGGNRTLGYNKTSIRMGLGFPKKLVFTHKYCETLSTSSFAGGIRNNILFRCNGMYDPNHTGVGHQPMYFDQLAALYDHFVVIGSKIKVSVSPASTANPVCTIGLYVNDDTTITPNTDGIMEQFSSRYRVVPAGSNNTYYLTDNWSAKKYFGGSILANTELQGTSSADPTEQSLFVFFMDSSLAATPASFQVVVEIEYVAVWKELKDIASS